jgi:hypothetical protein
MATAAVATACLWACDDLTTWIIDRTYGSQTAFVSKLANVVNWGKVEGGPGGQATVAVSLLLVLAILAIALIIVLWFELLLRNTALAVLLAVSPIAAAGQISETTKTWWQRTVSACIQLFILKPVIALVLGIGFLLAGGAKGIEELLEGLLALGLAAFSWPVIGRFFTFATIQSTSSGLATALGFAAGQMGGGGTAGIDPSQWSRNTEQQTMASRGGTAGGDGPAAGVPAGGGPARTPGGGAAGGAAAGLAGGAVLAGIGAGLRAVHGAGTMLAGRMETMAGHGGLPGAYPYSTIGSGQRIAPPRARQAARQHPPPPQDAGGTAAGTRDSPAPDSGTGTQDAPQDWRGQEQWPEDSGYEPPASAQETPPAPPQETAPEPPQEPPDRQAPPAEPGIRPETGPPPGSGPGSPGTRRPGTTSEEDQQ